MVFRASETCRKAKSSDEIRGAVGHNADVTKIFLKLHNSTPYVNDCNLSTPNIEGIRRLTTLGSIRVYIIYAIKMCQKLKKTV